MYEFLVDLVCEGVVELQDNPDLLAKILRSLVAASVEEQELLTQEAKVALRIARADPLHPLAGTFDRAAAVLIDDPLFPHLQQLHLG